MIASLLALFGSLVVFVLAMVAAFRYLHAHGHHVNALAKIDLISFSLGFTGALTLVPETMHAFSPELLLNDVFVGTIIDRLDYFAYVLVPCSFGMGVARRVTIVRTTSKRF